MTDRRQRALERFFRRELLPLHGRPDVWRRDEPGPAPSYWIVLDRPPLRPQDFELGLGDRDRIADALERFWHGTPLAGIGRRLVRLSRRFAGTQLKQDVSAFVYEMF